MRRSIRYVEMIRKTTRLISQKPPRSRSFQIPAKSRLKPTIAFFPRRIPNSLYRKLQLVGKTSTMRVSVKKSQFVDRCNKSIIFIFLLF